MKNLPKKIYLQISDADFTIDTSIDDFNELVEGSITWNTHKINDNDIEYTLNDLSNFSCSLGYDINECGLHGDFVTGCLECKHFKNGK